MARVELAIKVVGLSQKQSQKTFSFRVLGFFHKKTRSQRDIIKKVADVFRNISFTNTGWR